MTPGTTSAGSPPSGEVTPPSASTFHCGTLVYTRASLFLLFSWLLFGDFCFSLMEVILPNVLPLMLRAEGAPNAVLSLAVTIIPGAMNFLMNPIISTMSDRHRGPRGRRIPFLLWSAPFITIFLILTGFSRELGAGLYPAISSLWPGLPRAGVVIAMICLCMVCFRFFELFVNTIFWYLFNDVVPAAFMGRFLGFFRVVGSLAGALFNFVLLPYAESHSSTIFLVVSLLYGAAFSLMCLNVKEGSYPPPEDRAETQISILARVISFFKECFSHRLFRLIFAYNGTYSMALSLNAFTLFLAFSIGLSLADVGKIAGVALLVSTALMYPMGWLVDRFHPLRVMLAAKVGYVLVISIQLVFLFHDFSHSTAFWIYAAVAGITVPITVANGAAALPMLMKLLPRARFGQFCSANAMCGAVGTIIGGALGGVCLDVLKSTIRQGDFYYRFLPLWGMAFMSLSTGLLFLIFREWKKLGGDKNFRRPVDDNFTAFYRQDSDQIT